MKTIEIAMEEAKKQKSKLHEPSLASLEKIHKIVYNIIKKHNLLIYGGVAIDSFLLSNKKDGIYSDKKECVDEYHDVEVYTIDTMKIIQELFNECKEKHEINLEAREAIHISTITVKYYYVDIIDITYCPQSILENIPYFMYNEIKYCEVDVLRIDMYRMASDPLNSHQRWDKSKNRLDLMEELLFEKHKISPKLKELPLLDNTTCDEKLLNHIKKNHLVGNNDIIECGLFALNYFLEESIVKKPISYSYFELVCHDLDKFVMSLLSDKEIKNDSHILEKYGYLDWIGYTVEIFVKNKLVCIVHDSKTHCISFKISNKCQIASFDYMMYYWLIKKLRYDDEISQMVPRILETVAQQYFIKNKKYNLEDTIFQRYIPSCGHSVFLDERVKKHKIIQERKNNKKPPIFVYRSTDNNSMRIPDFDKYVGEGKIVTDIDSLYSDFLTRSINWAEILKTYKIVRRNSSNSFYKKKNNRKSFDYISSENFVLNLPISIDDSSPDKIDTNDICEYSTLDKKLVFVQTFVDRSVNIPYQSFYIYIKICKPPYRRLDAIKLMKKIKKI